MIPKSGYRFSEKIMLQQKLERDDDSKKSHPALAFPRSTRDRGPSPSRATTGRRSGDDRSRFRRNSSINWAATELRWFGRGRWKSGVFATRAPRSSFRPRLGSLHKITSLTNQSTAPTVRAPKEASMKQFWLVAGAGLVLVSLLPNEAFAQGPRMVGGGGGGGFRGAAI